MAIGHSAGVARAIRTLWGEGAVGGLSDAQLLARFVERRSGPGETAFEVLVARHGPMVLRVVREVLGDRDSAQDAFQATFLVLARKAGSIGRPEALGPWLHGVARRVARKARAEADRRRRHERRAAELSPREVGPIAEPSDHGPAVHDEVARLPESFRAAVVLCYFEGMTYDQAARQLGVTESTVRGRLARARGLLRGRLARRGFSSWPAWAPSDLPDRWIRPTARAASRFAMGKEAAPATVAGLAEGVLRTMFLPKLKAAAVLVALQVAAGVGVYARRGAEAPATPSTTDRPVPVDTRPADPPRLEMTLDAAIERGLREDADLRSKFYEIPEARADILSADLRANPTFYADSQLLPYGRYTRDRPGGQTQYDVNISHPLDLTHKRQARAVSAARATRVSEAQYQDAVRLQIDRLSSAFVNALRASKLAGLRAEAVDRLDRIAEEARRRGERQVELHRIALARAVAVAGRTEAAAALDRARRALASVLNLPEADAGGLEVVGEFGPTVAIPATERLVAEALVARPDLVAFRLGLERVKADVQRQYASRFESDVYRLYQPYKPRGGLDDPLAWAMGTTTPIYAPWDTARSYPLPVYNRNSGNIQRAQLNVNQTQVQLSDQEQKVVSEVGQASRECTSTLDAALMAGEKDAEARRALDLARTNYDAGESTVPEVLKAMSLDDEAARLRVEAQASHWRSRLSLNTAIGRRVLP